MFVFGDVWTLHIIDLNGYQPDLSANGEGLGIYDGCACAQTANLSSVRGRTVRGAFDLDNVSAESDSFLVNGSGGDRFFGVTYRDGSNNVTADILTGNHDTGSIEGNGKVTIDVEVKPNKRTLQKTTRKKGRKVKKWLKKSLLVSVGAESLMDASKVDEAYFKINHR